MWCVLSVFCTHFLRDSFFFRFVCTKRVRYFAVSFQTRKNYKFTDEKETPFGLISRRNAKFRHNNQKTCEPEINQYRAKLDRSKPIPTYSSAVCTETSANTKRIICEGKKKQVNCINILHLLRSNILRTVYSRIFFFFEFILMLWVQ